jgi:hypothetical protein|nr:MAG TPA: hypothetical protein [Caudoviricetes sp.]
MNRIKRILVDLLAYAILTPFVMGIAALELIVAIIYLLRYVVSMSGLAVLYTMGYIFLSMRTEVPFRDKRMAWPTYKYVLEQEFRQCLCDIRRMSSFTN